MRTFSKLLVATSVAAVFGATAAFSQVVTVPRIKALAHTFLDVGERYIAEIEVGGGKVVRLRCTADGATCQTSLK